MTTEKINAEQFEFHWKYGEFEIRTSHSPLGKPAVELIKWEDNSDRCLTLASYSWSKDEGGEWRFIGDRPFVYISSIEIAKIWKQLWLAGELFTDWYEKEFDKSPL